MPSPRLTFKPRGHRHVALQVLAADFRLPGHLPSRRQRAERGGLAGRARPAGYCGSCRASRARPPDSARGSCRRGRSPPPASVAGSPCRIALASSSISCGVKPGARRHHRIHLNVIAGPLMVLSMPFITSTTPLIFLIRSPTFGAQFRSSAGSCANSLISIGSGALVRSPIMSCSS